MDAMRFFVSSLAAPYRPQNWDDAQVDAAKAAAASGPVQEQVDWHNPQAGGLAPRIALIGHGVGGTAVAFAQECSALAAHWTTIERCGGRSFPIHAVIGWDSLSGAFPVKPVAPALDENVDHWYAPEPRPTRVRASGSSGAFEFWRDAGLDVFTLTIRGGTHEEWADEASPFPATTYGRHLAYFYTLMWLDRYLQTDADRARRAADALLAAPRMPASHPGSAAYLSVRYLSMFRLTHPTRGRVGTDDVRAWAGRSAVGDWAGANEDCAASVLPCPFPEGSQRTDSGP
jgi:hypothetical protein